MRAQVEDRYLRVKNYNALSEMRNFCERDISVV